MAKRSMMALAVIVASSLLIAVPGQAAEATTVISVDTAHPFGALPSDFVGLSYEMRELASWCTTGTCTGNFNASQGNLAAIMRNLGRSDLRIGGNQLDRDTLWIPEGQQRPDPLPSWVADVVGPSDIQRLSGVLSATGWKAEVGINMAHFDSGLAADQANAMASILDGQLSGIACGNEPDHYASNHYRPSPYDFAEHKADWDACTAVIPLKTPIAGPDLSSVTRTANWFSQFAASEKDRVSIYTIHNYTGSTSMTQLLSPEIHTSEVANALPQLNAAHAAGVPLRMDETNSAVGGGLDGVSNTYASALWGMDYNLVMAQAGFAGLNFHSGLGVCNAPLYNGRFQRYTAFCAANEEDMNAKVYKAMPLYYGMYMASQMGPGQFMPVTVTSDRNVTAYAVKGSDGRVRVAVISKEDTSGAPVTLSMNIPGAHGNAKVIHLTGSTLGSADGVMVQGAQVGRNGNLCPGKPDKAHSQHGVIQTTIAAGSAAIFTLP